MRGSVVSCIRIVSDKHNVRTITVNFAPKLLMQDQREGREHFSTEFQRRIARVSKRLI